VSDLKKTVWSTVKEESAKRYRNTSKITYGGTEITETQTWGQLGISDDATVILETSVSMEMMVEAQQIPTFSARFPAYDPMFLLCMPPLYPRKSHFPSSRLPIYDIPPL